MKFIDYLEQAWQQTGSLLCVGIDPDAEKIPPAIMAGAEPFYNFGCAVIDATAPYVCAYKPQIAHFSAQAAEPELEKLIRYIKLKYPQIPVILDAKRGDIGSTARKYVIEAFDRYQADAVTVNPYMGGDTLEPFLQRADKGVFILCRTSNPGSEDFQSLSCNQQPLFSHIAQAACSNWNQNHNVGLVVGATWPQNIGSLRAQVSDMPLLIPGIGTQGGEVEAVLSAGLTQSGSGLLINVSRSVIYAGEKKTNDKHQFFAAAADAARDFRQLINQYRSV